MEQLQVANDVCALRIVRGRRPNCAFRIPRICAGRNELRIIGQQNSMRISSGFKTFLICMMLPMTHPEPIYASEDIPQHHKRYTTLLSAFAAKLTKGRPLEERCNEITSLTGDASLDEILRPYRERQALISNGAIRFPILDCTYSAANQGRSGRVIMMNPPADQLATWIVTACTKPGIRPPNQTEDDCMAKAARMIWLQANAQYPITGYVPEPANLCKKTWPESKTALFGFRDGVTVGLDGTPHEAGNPPANPCEIPVSAICTIEPIKDAQFRAALGAKVTKLASTAYARLSNLPLRKHLADTAANHCPAANGDPPEWLARARASYLDGVGSNSYGFLEEWVTSDEKDSRFTCKRLTSSNLLDACSERL
jgi:hypothetical protein